jgi:hypothetical protein
MGESWRAGREARRRGSAGEAELGIRFGRCGGDAGQTFGDAVAAPRDDEVVAELLPQIEM